MGEKMPAGWTSQWEATCPRCTKKWGYKAFTCDACGNRDTTYAYQNDDSYNEAEGPFLFGGHDKNCFGMSPQLELRCTRCGVVTDMLLCPDDNTPMLGGNVRARFDMPGPLALMFRTLFSEIACLILMFVTLGIFIVLVSIFDKQWHQLTWKLTPKRPRWYPFAHPILRERYIKVR